MAANPAAALTNLERARIAWGEDMPAWVRLLASACDAANQRQVAARLVRSSGWVSRILNRNYGGSYEEAETIVRVAYGSDDVVCPLWGSIPLASCVRSRRRKGPAQNLTHRLHDRTCPTCPNNSDRAPGAEEE